jgi:sulfite exporter TauE/SafE
MLASLLLSAFLMGLAGGPHCLAMCGSACMGMTRWPGQSAMRHLVLFQTGRLIGYASLGAVAAVSMNAVGWLASETPVLRPVWRMMHVAAVLWGLWLIWHAEQPLWLSRTANAIWKVVSRHAGRPDSHSLSTLWLGMAWALLPCGLLYSALLVAAFTPGPLQGALVMAAFALGGGLALTVLPWLWSHFNNGSLHGGQVAIHWNTTPIKNPAHWGTRISGLLLAVTAGWGLWTGLTHTASPWCLPV